MSKQKRTEPQKLLFYRIRQYVPKPLMIILCTLLICGGMFRGVFWFIEERPQYLELNIPFPRYIIEWGYTERSTVIWDDNGAKYYLWRQEAICNKSECGSWADVVKIFDEWLELEGWESVSDYYGNPCTIVLPEMELLERGENGYIVFWPSDFVGWNNSASVCLAVYTGENDSYWQITWGTTNPSLRTEFMNGF